MPQFDFVDMVHPDGTPNPSGLGTVHGFAPLGYFAANGLKAPDAVNDADGTGASIGSITTPHVFTSGKCMKKVYGTVNKGEAKDDAVGDDDSTNSKGTVTIAHPGIKPELIAQKKKLHGALGILFVKLADGLIMQYGSEEFPCHLKINWGSGNNEGYRGYTITATCYGDGIIYTPGLNFTAAA